MKIVPGFLVLLYYIVMCMPPVGAHSVHPPPKISNASFQMFLTGQTLRGNASIVPCKYFLGQYRIILSADTASEVRQMPSQKRR